MVYVRRVKPPEYLHYKYGPEALEETPNEGYGHKLRRLRLLLGMSQLEVAEMLGCNPLTISNWEDGTRQGVTPKAAELPRRGIALLSQRLRSRKKRANGTQ